MNFDGQYIYIIKEREFINTNEDVYKIGSTKSVIENMSHIPRGSNVHMLVKVQNATKTEEEIVTQLKKCKSLIHYSCIGDEYFHGDIITIINIASQAIVLLRDEESEDDDTSSCESADESAEEEVNEKACSDPVVLISRHIFSRKEELQGQSIDSVDFYTQVMSSVNLPCHFTYNKFAAILTKHRIYEQKMAYGPAFVFPTIPW
jgi:hypothetical protein